MKGTFIDAPFKGLQKNTTKITFTLSNTCKKCLDS